MRLRAKSLMAILLTGLVLGLVLMLACGPARAQIVSVMDERGQRVYINTAPKPVETVTSSKNTTQSANATKAPQSASGLNGGSSLAPAVNASQNPSSSGSHGLSSPRLEDLVRAAANRHGVDPNLVRAVIQTESGGNPSAVSRKGAVGLMQLMPTTALELGVRNMYNAAENLEAGVRYLHTLLIRYNGDLDRALAAYNAGAGAVDRAGGVPRYRETRDYVRKVTNNYFAADGSRSSGSITESSSGLGGKATSTPFKSATPATSKAPAQVVVPPANKIYKTTDSSGRTVWAN
jgi:hypothetical protein